ncbi:hypothetical protein OJF2_51710 [Aquisphaera giovannonii]|uniref:HTH luxR-type domain-containing protein n=1 Tax=Aquisphaera giovannonii TaxID=406548 RepID=A0A5B9W894_9BACT|nr:hypothetical protein [Aquisphaera giovannonii]QEH36587.1 hypothetical protein OJF2_51710 [Aquisphaera giovannonii]
MKSQELIELGELLGWGWQTMLASHLKVSDRTIRRKVSGSSRITAAEAEAIRLYVKHKLKGKQYHEKPQAN